MRLKIISGGTGASTKIVNVDTGEAVEGVVALVYRVEVGKAAEVTLTMQAVEIESETELRGELPTGKKSPG